MVNKKKLLFILPGFGFGGTVFSTLNMISLIKNRYDIYVLPMHPYGPVKEYYNNINVIQPSTSLMAVSFMPTLEEHNLIRKLKLLFYKLINHICIKLNIDFKNFIYNRQANLICSKYNFDIVASCQEYQSTEFASYFKSPNLFAWNRTEMSIFFKDLSVSEKERIYNIYKKFKKIVSVSNTTSNDFINCFPKLKNKCISIHNIQNIDNIIKKSQEKIEDPYEKDIFIIVSVGRIAKQKQFYKIPSIAKILHDEMNLNFKWYIIGDGNVLGENDRLQQELDKYQNRDYVKCIGNRLNPYPYIANANLLVNTSYYEACPRVVAEAQILHTPVVCADFSSAREFVINNQNGFVEKIELLWKPISIMISNKETYKRIKSNCNNYFSNNDTIINQLYNLFDS